MSNQISKTVHNVVIKKVGKKIELHIPAGMTGKMLDSIKKTESFQTALKVVEAQDNEESDINERLAAAK